jgi:hypothetical protein
LCEKAGAVIADQSAARDGNGEAAVPDESIQVGRWASRMIVVHKFIHRLAFLLRNKP